MQTLETISEMLETTGDIQSIVRTMKALSAVSIRQYEQAEAAMSGYERTIDLGLTALLTDRRSLGLSLPEAFEPEAAKDGLIVIGSDRGLCGRYNQIVTRAAEPHLGHRTAVLGAIGARAAARLGASGHRVDRLFLQPGSVAGLRGLVQSVIVAVEGWTRDPGLFAMSGWCHNRLRRARFAAARSRSLRDLVAVSR